MTTDRNTSWLHGLIGPLSVQDDGAALPVRNALNFIGCTVVDNPASDSTDISITVADPEAAMITGAQFAAAAAAAAVAGVGVVITDPVTVTTALGTIAVPIRFEAGGKLIVNSGGSVLLSGPLEAPPMTIFVDNTGGVGSGLRVRSKVARVLPQWWGATGDGVTDDTVAIQTAITQVGQSVVGTVFFLPGTYMISVPITSAKTGVMFDGTGPDSAIVKAMAGFTGTALFILGNKATTTVTSKMGLSRITLNTNAVTGVRGLEFYGLRDATTFDSVYITGTKLASGVYCNQAGNAVGVAAGRMSQGVQFRNCHVVTANDMTGTAFWDLNGLFESQLLGCKALGSTAPATANAFGFRLGAVAETRGVLLEGCSAGAISSGTGNIGILYSEWALYCWDQFTTFEYITGAAVKFHGSAISGSTLPAFCFSLHPRLYNITQVGIIDPVYVFGVSTACRGGPVVRYNTLKTWVQFLAGSGSSNLAEVHDSVAPESLVGSRVLFDTGCPADSAVRGFALYSANTVPVLLTPALVARPAVTGSRVGGTALTSLLSVLAARGVVTDSTASGTTLVTVTSPGSAQTPAADIRDIYIFTVQTTSHTLNAPSGSTTGATMTLMVKNDSGGAITTTFAAGYKMATWTSPATGYSRSITFRYSGTQWIEVTRTPSDVPN